MRPLKKGDWLRAAPASTGEKRALWRLSHFFQPAARARNKNIDIEAEITLKLGGKVDKASDDGNVTLGAFDAADWVNYQGHPAVNNSSTVTWKIKLKPGDNFEPTINYHHYTRH